MRYTGKKRRQYFLSLLLCTCMLGQIFIYPARANDRSADIIGSHPLLVKNIITPAGLSGQGQMVGIADSGLDDGSMTDIHPDLQGEAGTIPKVMLQTYTDRELADDPDGHGTFMAATIAGTGKASQGKYRGIAPGASLYFQGLLDKDGNLQVPDDIDKLFRPAYSAGVRIHVNGWGGGSNKYGGNSAGIDKFVYRYPDFLPVFGAGNSGPGLGTLTMEANSKNALVVGASQVPRPAFDPEARFADQAAALSSRGPTRDGRIKPDLLAPGLVLISACSSLTEGNFAGDPLYTRMGGTSMAAAVTGGALALLSEQLSVQYENDDPSAALLKALLINGARAYDQAASQQGFGILDLAGTILALQEGTFQFMDSKNELSEGAADEYKIKVTDKNMPVKVTLAWSDPPGSLEDGSALINDLDLYVQAPNGKVFMGNDFTYQGKKDHINNVEQVTIEVPETGEYTIGVQAGKIGAGNGQDYGLAYGQALKTGVVEKADSDKLILADGTTLNLDSVKLQQVVDGVMTDARTPAMPGSEVYFKADKAYVFGQSWHTGGVQALSTPEGDLLLEINTSVREGGYYLDTQAKELEGTIISNGLPVSSISQIPLGSELQANVNPVLQTLWKLETSNQKVSGIVLEVDPANGRLKLVNDSTVYEMAPWAAIAYNDKLIDCTPQDTSYSTAEQNDIARLLPGSAVTMQVSPRNGLVQALFLERPLIIGRVAQIDEAEEMVRLDTGNSYELFPDIMIYRDQTEAELEDIQDGDLIIGQLLPGSSTIIYLQAYSQADYGRVTYISPQKNSLYIMDAGNHSHTYTYDKQTEVFGMGIQLETSVLEAGDWVRVVADPTGNKARRVDIAQIKGEAVKTLVAVDSDKKNLIMTDGSQYTYHGSTRISRGGYCINAEDLSPGARVSLTTLHVPLPWTQLLAGVEIYGQPDIKAPDLELTFRALNGVLIIQGYTSADRLYLYRIDGSQERIVVDDKGQVSYLSPLLENEQNLQVIALETSNGAIKDVNMPIYAYLTESETSYLNDISGHWAEKFITELARRNIVEGYEDGSFRPDRTISRAELMVLLAHHQQLDLAEMPVTTVFTDENSIPWWALQEVLAAQQAGLINGYPDGSFGPDQAVTRQELSLIFANWQADGMVNNLFPGETLQPNRLITRAEAAAIIARF